MSAFPPGARNFQLPSPYRGVVYFYDGHLIVLIDGKKVVDEDLAAHKPVPKPKDSP